MHAYLIRLGGSSKLRYYIGGTSSVDILADLAVFKIKKTYLVAD